MGIKLLIFLALIIGVLYCLHLLVQDYQALSAPRLLRFLFKRDVSSQNRTRPSVRWKRILDHDQIQCARYLYCDLGARPTNNAVRRGFAFMLTLVPKQEDSSAWQQFKEAYYYGKLSQYSDQKCHNKYFMCPFNVSMLFDLINYLLKNDSSNVDVR